MAVVKLTLNDEYYQRLKEMADAENKSIQDYIRDKIFNLSTIFTPEEAIRRIKNGNFESSEGFTLPDVYGDDWTIERGLAGVFGKKFYNYVKKKPELGIRFKDMGKYGRRAVYTYSKKVQNIYINKQSRRAVRKYTKKYSMQNTKKIIFQFA